jgi:putative membrane protein
MSAGTKERHMKRLITAVAVAFGLFGLQAFAQNSTQDFVTKVAVSDMFEIQASKVAAQKGNAEIKPFAQRMIKDHTKITQELKEMIGKSKVKLPTEMDANHQQKLAKLQKADGKDFNSMYATMQVQGHEEVVKLFESYSSSGDNAQLKAWAAKTLQALKEHLEHAKRLK